MENDMYNLDEFEPQYEPSEADEILSDAKDKLYAVIKRTHAADFENITRKCDRLENENASLRETLNGVTAREMEIERKEKELERKTKKMPVKEFFGQHAAIMWKADYHFENGVKCDKCDDRRNIQYTTPSGREQEEKCTCYKNETVYAPQEQRLVELRRDSRDGDLRFWFKPYDDGDGYSSGRIADNVYAGESFEDANKHNLFFNNVDDCQAYCDWKNGDKS